MWRRPYIPEYSWSLYPRRFCISLAANLPQFAGEKVLRQAKSSLQDSLREPDSARERR
jgi:hypothetical protein